MRRYQLLIPCLLMILFSCSGNKKMADKNKGQWTSLFNGKDLTGWQVKIAGHPAGENFGNTFRVENGILSTRYDQYDSFRSRFGALYFNKQFTNYRLKVEYRFVGETTAGAPSWGFRDGGIQYHSQSPASVQLNQLFPVCLEYNLLGGNGKDERPTGEICASGMKIDIEGKQNTLYCTPPATKRTFHGDQWVTAEIEVRDGVIIHYVNGEKILEFSNPHYDPSHAIGKTFIVNGDDKVRAGYISLQSNSHPMDFRKIEIMEY
jgi:hypothetical protein